MITTTPALDTVKHAVAPDSIGAPPIPGSSFSEVFERVLSKSELSNGFEAKLTSMQSKLISQSQFSPRDLLLLQIQFGRFNLQVEMVSKVAESATTTLKKIQNG